MEVEGGKKKKSSPRSSAVLRLRFEYIYSFRRTDESGGYAHTHRRTHINMHAHTHTTTGRALSGEYKREHPSHSTQVLRSLSHTPRPRPTSFLKVRKPRTLDYAHPVLEMKCSRFSFNMGKGNEPRKEEDEGCILGCILVVVPYLAVHLFPKKPKQTKNYFVLLCACISGNVRGRESGNENFSPQRAQSDAGPELLGVELWGPAGSPGSCWVLLGPARSCWGSVCQGPVASSGWWR